MGERRRGKGRHVKERWRGKKEKREAWRVEGERRGREMEGKGEACEVERKRKGRHVKERGVEGEVCGRETWERDGGERGGM